MKYVFMENITEPITENLWQHFVAEYVPNVACGFALSPLLLQNHRLGRHFPRVFSALNSVPWNEVFGA